jgi:hypothetical protein
MTTTAPGAASEAASIGPLKRSRIGAIVEKPSRALTASCNGSSGFGGWMLSVPSVEPAKYASKG